MFLDPFELVGLTHPLNPQIPSWDGRCGFHHTLNVDYKDCAGEAKFRVQSIGMKAGAGTHMDAPSHCIQNAANIAEIPLSKLVVPVVVIDVSSKAHADYMITRNDIQQFESKHGKIPENSLVIGHTGWCSHWNNPTKYRNVDPEGNMHFPHFSSEAVDLLLQRQVVGIGIDTLSPDKGHKDQFPVHMLMLGAGKYIIENVTNANLLPPTGAYAIALPLKIQEGTESPIRLIAMVPR